MKRCSASLLCAMVLAILLLPAAALAAQRGETVRVGWYDTGDGMEEGTAHAYDFEYPQVLSQYTGWEYEYVTGTWDECLA